MGLDLLDITVRLEKAFAVRIPHVLEDALGVPPHDIHPHSLLIRDLGANC